MEDEDHIRLEAGFIREIIFYYLLCDINNNISACLCYH